MHFVLDHGYGCTADLRGKQEQFVVEIGWEKEEIGERNKFLMELLNQIWAKETVGKDEDTIEEVKKMSGEEEFVGEEGFFWTKG